MDFHFFSRDIAIVGELSHFSLSGWTSSILRTFLGGTSEKTHPVVHGVGHEFGHVDGHGVNRFQS